jgi:ATP-dependent Clp protease ATP-binding subunit ClpC
MFEKYTEKARRVIFSARFFASELGSTVLEPEHILLAILREEPDLFRPWLKAESDYATLRAAIERREDGREKIPDSVPISFSRSSKSVLAYAEEESERQQDRHIRASHFLAALLRVPNTVAAVALASCGIELQEVRLVFVASLKHSHPHRPETDDLHQLVDQLPAAQLGQARTFLQSLCQGQEPA